MKYKFNIITTSHNSPRNDVNTMIWKIIQCTNTMGEHTSENDNDDLFCFFKTFKDNPYISLS